MPGDEHVLVSVQHDPDGSAQLLCRHGADGGDGEGAGLLPAETAAHPLHLAHHSVHLHAQCTGRDPLRVRGALA